MRGHAGKPIQIKSKAAEAQSYGNQLNIMIKESYQAAALNPEMNKDLMEQDHVALAGIFRALNAAFGEGDAARAFELLDLAWARLAIHIRAEHLRLFPAILNALAKDSDAGDLARPSLVEARAAFARLHDDHDFFMRELACAVQTLREMRRDASGSAAVTEELANVRGKIMGVIDRLEEHNRLEEEQVYRWPETLLSAAAQEELRTLMRDEIENLPPRFRASVPADISSEGRRSE